MTRNQIIGLAEGDEVQLHDGNHYFVPGFDPVTLSIKFHNDKHGVLVVQREGQHLKDSVLVRKAPKVNQPIVRAQQPTVKGVDLSHFENALLIVRTNKDKDGVAVVTDLYNENTTYPLIGDFKFVDGHGEAVEFSE